MILAECYSKGTLNFLQRRLVSTDQAKRLRPRPVETTNRSSPVKLTEVTLLEWKLHIFWRGFHSPILTRMTYLFTAPIAK